MENFEEPDIAGFGLIARVYRVIDKRDREVKALKCYPRVFNHLYYQNEVKICFELKHANIVMYLESFESPFGLFIVMEYCEGGNLRQKLNDLQIAKSQITLNERLRWLKEILYGIQYIHSKGLTHRDIHPRNIMFKNEHIKIGGLRIIRENNEGNTRLGSLRYKSPEIVGTIAMPEHMLEKSESTALFHVQSSDIWSCGVVFYEIICLRKMIEERSALNIVARILSPEFCVPPFESENKQLEKIFPSVLSIDPDQRPTATQIIEALNDN